MQSFRQHTVPDGLNCFDHTRDTGGGLCMADVRFERPEPQGPVVGPVLAVGGQQSLCLDRVAQGGAGAVGFDGVDVRGGQPSVRECRTDHPLLGRAVRRGQAVGRAVGVHRRAPDHGQDLMPEALGVTEAFQQQQPDAFGPAGTVRRGGERLASPVRCQATLPGELDEPEWGGHDRGAAGQRQVGLARA